jgi:hypothetical protein
MTSRPSTRRAARLVVCENLDDPGLGRDFPGWIGLGTTVDQARIERALEGMQLDGRTQILHVGVGDSGFAQRFSGRVGRIDGITIWEDEKRLADALPFANYAVHVVNKYSAAFASAIERRYDFVVDNNLASYVCCTHHFHQMLENYLRCLGPGGRVLTDQRGMDYSEAPPWKLTYEDLVALAPRFPVEVGRVTDTVYELRARALVEG